MGVRIAAAAGRLTSVRAGVILVLTSAAVGLGAAAAASAAPLFPQCPAVGNNLGCSQLIVVARDGSVTVQTDPAAPASGFDGSEDTLIGLQNNSKGPISSINLASASSTIFGFDQDGLCNPTQWPSAPPTTPPNCPGPQGFGTTGYEGPNDSFANISSNNQTGTVTFTQPVTPGASAYWALEEALTAGQLQSGAGGHPITSAPVVVGPVASFNLTCVGATPCNGVAKLTVVERFRGKSVNTVLAARKHKKAKPRTRKVVVGSVTFSAAGGETVPISVSLNRAGLALRSTIGGFPAGLSVAVTEPAGPPQVTKVANVRFTGAKKHTRRR